MSDAPEKIWLQIGDDELCTYSEAMKAGADVSWCHEQIFQYDIEYIRADLVAAKDKEIEMLTNEHAAAIKILSDAQLFADLRDKDLAAKDAEIASTKARLTSATNQLEAIKPYAAELEATIERLKAELESMTALAVTYKDQFDGQ